MKTKIAKIMITAVLLAVVVAASAKDESQKSTKPAPQTVPANVNGEKAQPEEQAGNKDDAQKSRSNPFAPSSAMRNRADGNVAQKVAADSQDRPVLEGVIMKGKAVLACFKIGDAYAVVEPGEIIGTGPNSLKFMSLQNEVATLKDSSGKTHEVRIRIRTITPVQKSKTAIMPDYYED